VTQGGALLLGTGGSWHKTLAGLPPARLPMQGTGSTVLASASTWGPGRVEVGTGTVAAGSSIWLADRDRPLLVESSVGAGSVEMATFDWTQDSITSWSGSAALLRQALVRSTYGNLRNQTPGVAAIAKMGVGNSIANKGGALTSVLGNLPALNLPAWWVIGTLVLLYVLLVGPVNYFVLRALNRRALAVVTVAASAIVGAAGGPGASMTTQAVTLPGMNAFTLRGFANETVVAAPQVIGTSQLSGGKLVGTIRNPSTVNFVDGIVFYGNSYQKFGGLAPGGSVAFNFQVVGGSSFGGPPVYINAYPNAFNGHPMNSASETERENETRTAVLSTLLGNGGPGLQGLSVPTVVLWTRQPFQTVTVNGGHPRAFAES